MIAFKWKKIVLGYFKFDKKTERFINVPAKIKLK